MEYQKKGVGIMKHVFISGATGYIGTRLSLALAQKGYVVHALYRDESKTAELKHPNIRLFKGNLFDKKSLLTAMQSCEGLFHTAAFAKIWSKDRNRFFKTNVEGTKNVIEAALEAGIKRGVFTSTAGVYGPSTSSPVNENHQSNLPFFGEYEHSKHQADELIMATKNFDAVIVYPTRVYGPGLMSESNGVTRMIQKYINGEWHFIPGNGKSIGNYVYVDDIVQGHVLAYLDGKPGNKYFLSGTNLSYNDFFDRVKIESGLTFSLIRIPAVIIQVITWVMMLKTYLTNKPPLLTPALARKFLYNWETDCTKAMDEIGYSPTPFEEGLKNTLDWLSSNG